MATITISNEFDSRLALAAKTQGKTVHQIVNDLIIEYLEDLEDTRLAEAALRRVETGESHLLPTRSNIIHL